MSRTAFFVGTNPAPHRHNPRPFPITGRVVGINWLQAVAELRAAGKTTA